jgi:hypothetical protein
MSTLPLGRGMEMSDWIGVAGVGLNLLMLTLAQRGRVDTDAKGKEKGKAPNNKTWAADRPVPVRSPSPHKELSMYLLEQAGARHRRKTDTRVST